jgi:hypothetical protein
MEALYFSYKQELFQAGMGNNEGIEHKIWTWS